MPSSNLKMHTPNLVDSNIDRIAELFPNCITEKPKTDEQGNVLKDASGQAILERGIDFELLKQELSHSVIDGSQERYRLDWVGKREAIVTANSPIAKTLRPCRAESVNFDTTGNLFIEGDNLEALKLLQESYLGKVKTIYIDPPYNTGNDFIYNDDFAADTQAFFERSGQVDADGNRLVANTERNGRFHSDWLSMMYSRLKLARNLLADDGVIFISIDDNEIHNLRKICEDVFGYTNFIAELIVNSNSSKNNAKKISVSHEYILCFVKDFTKETKDWKIQKQQIKAYESRAKQLLKMNLTEDEIHQELLQLVKYPRFYDFDHFTYADKNGVYETDNSGGVDNGNFKTEILHPVTGKPCAKPNGGWRYKDETLKQMVKNNQIVFGKDESIIPRVKRYLHDYNEQVPKSNLYFDSQATTKWLKSEQLPFDFPKSIDLIKHILSFNDEKNALTLDFFAGSSTTAHAVMQLNAEDGGNRKFIMVQIPEATDSKSEAFKAGYPTIAEISKERIRRAGAKIRQDNADKDLSHLDTGFRVLKIDTTNMNDIYYRPQDYNQDLLATLENNIKEDRSDEDLLFQFMLDTGVPLSLPIERTELSSKSGGHTIYQVGGNSLIASLDYIDANMVNDIAALNPLKFITSERAIATDSDKTNIKERFKQLSPHTDVRFI